MKFSDLVNEFGFDPWTERDRNKDGKVGSVMPAWYMPNHMADEYRDVEEQERQLKRAGRDLEYYDEMKMKVAKERHKLDMVKESFPRPIGSQKDLLAGVINELGEIITRSMFTYSDMQSGAASAHDELQRSKDPVVKVPNNVARYILLCNGNVFGDTGNFRIKRDDAVRAWRIGRRILGESTWSEDLRPMERPEGVRRGDYEQIFRGFDPEKPIDVRVGKADPQMPETFIDGSLEDEPADEEVKVCEDCKGSMAGEHHMAKRCKSCRDIRKTNGRENTDKDTG